VFEYINDVSPYQNSHAELHRFIWYLHQTQSQIICLYGWHIVFFYFLQIKSYYNDIGIFFDGMLPCIISGMQIKCHQYCFHLRG